MNAAKHILVCAVFVACSGSSVWGSAEPNSLELASVENEYSHVRLEVSDVDSKPALAVVFEGTDDLHYYARSETAAAPGFNLKIFPSAPGVTFGEPNFPKWKQFYDTAQEKNVEVYVGNFQVLVPVLNAPVSPVLVTVRFTGMACTSQVCMPPFEQTLAAMVDFSAGTVSAADAALPTEIPQSQTPTITTTSDANEPADQTEENQQAVLPYSEGVFYLLAIVAGLSINIMPCVLPVIPLILIRLIDQSKRPGGNRLGSGLAFCIGVILFFVAFAAVSAIVNLTTGAVLDLNSLFRYPNAVIVLFLAIVFFGLAMLDVITLSLPSAVSNRQNQGAGFLGTAGMGFFAGILSTPCSGAVLGFVLVWAQTQPLRVSSTAIVLMGVGMALPYAIIVAIPSLLDRIPKPGTWMEIFKKSTGFLLFLIAAKVTLAALPKDRLLNVLMYGVIFSFSVWMWGKWVGFGTPANKKWAVRLIALAIAIGTGFWLLPETEQLKGWQDYDARRIQQAVAQNRPVLLKFTADWCTNCKEVEKKVFHDPEVIELLDAKNVLTIKADTTLNDYPATVDFKEVYGEAGNVPVTIILLPDGTEEKKRGIYDKKWLIDILTELPGETS